MRILKSRFNPKLIQRIIILGFSVIIIAIAIYPKTNRLPGKVAGTASSPLFVNDKFCDNPASPNQKNCTSFIPNVLATTLSSPYQNVNGPVAISGHVNITAGGGYGNEPLHLQSNSTFFSGVDAGGTQRLAINNDGGPTLNFYGWDTGWFNFMTVNETGPRVVSFNAGNVGIGTASPWSRLDVNGAISVGNNNGGGGNRLYLASGDPNHYIYSTGSYGNNMYFGEWGGNFHWIDTSNGAEKMTLTGGNIIANIGSFWNCCATNATLGISEYTASNNRLPSIQFHAAGYQEAYLRLNKDTRVFEMGDNQGIGVDLALLNGAGARNVYLSPRGTSYFNGGNVRANGEIQSTIGAGYGQFRAVAGNYGTIFRQDGWNFYILTTNAGNQWGGWNGQRPFYINDSTGYVTFGNGHNDLAENYFVSGKVLRASLVSIDNSSPSVATAADSLHRSLIGIVSTNPGAVMEADGGFHIGYATKGQYTDEKAPIALAGTVPALVTSQNGFISIGDPISLSSLPGFGTKAITAGAIIGQALETFQPNNTSCSNVSSLDVIKWPNDNGTNSNKPCFKLPDGTFVGKIMVAVNLSWYDPDTNLTSTTSFHLDFDQLRDAGNNLITRIGAFGQLIVGKIQAGIVDTQRLVVNGVDILDKLNQQQQEIDQLKATVQQLQQQLQNR